MTISSDQIITIFKETEGLLEGHFQLTSGLHSNRYFQCARVFQYPKYAEILCAEIANHFKDAQLDVVVSPAVGGIVVGQEVARLLGVRHIFTERASGEMTLRRGFAVTSGEKALVVEDVTTTGGSVKEVIQTLQALDASIIAVGAVVDRSGGQVDFGVPYFSLLQIDVETFQPEACPLCKAGGVAVKPGSRGLK